MRSVAARRCRNEPSNGPCLRSRLVADSPRRAHRRERAGVAARDPSQADRRAEIHERLLPRAAENAWPVRRCTRSTFTSTGRTSSPSAKQRTAAAVYGPTPGSCREVVGPALAGDDPRGAVKVQRRAGCSRAPATRGSRRPPRRPRATRPSANARATPGSAARPVRPASAAASPRSRGSRRDRASRRHGRSRPFAANHSSSRASTRARVRDDRARSA